MFFQLFTFLVFQSLLAFMLLNLQHHLTYFLFLFLAILLNLWSFFLTIILYYHIQISFCFQDFIIFIDSLNEDLLFKIQIVYSYLFVEFHGLIPFMSFQVNVSPIVLLASVEVSSLYLHSMILTFLSTILNLWSLLHILFSLLKPLKFLLMFHF